MKSPTKEQIYDEKINPLMAQMIAICKENKIAMLASFAIPTPEDDGLRCCTALLEDSFEPPREFLKAFEHLKPKRPAPALMITTTHADGSKTMTAILG